MWESNSLLENHAFKFSKHPSFPSTASLPVVTVHPQCTIYHNTQISSPGTCEFPPESQFYFFPLTNPLRTGCKEAHSQSLTTKPTHPVQPLGHVATRRRPNPPSDHQTVFPPGANLQITVSLYFLNCFNMLLQVLFWREVWFAGILFLAKIQTLLLVKLCSKPTLALSRLLLYRHLSNNTPHCWCTNELGRRRKWGRMRTR